MDQRPVILSLIPVLTLGLLAASGCGSPAGSSGDAAADPVDAAAWAQVLSEHAKAGGLDYAGLLEDREDLEAFLRQLKGAKLDGLSHEARVAFWTNAYNAVVAHFVLEHYPGMTSVREVDGFFDELTFPVAGEELTLDEIEGRGRALGDPRVHFSVVCASTSCPDLRSEPYEAARLERQLQEDLQRFLADETKGMRYDREANTLWLSSIFKWYAGDFTGGSTVVAFFARSQVLEWLLPNLDEELAQELRQRDPAIRYLDYDWSLNDR